MPDTNIPTAKKRRTAHILYFIESPFQIVASKPSGRSLKLRYIYPNQAAKLQYLAVQEVRSPEEQAELEQLLIDGLNGAVLYDLRLTTTVGYKALEEARGFGQLLQTLQNTTLKEYGEFIASGAERLLKAQMHLSEIHSKLLELHEYVHDLPPLD